MRFMSTAKVRSNRFTALLLCIAAVLFMLIPHTLSDVSYTEERADKMLFPSLPMGTQEYFLFVDPVRTGYTSGDYGNFYGKRVGVNNNSIQAGYLRDWMNSYEIHADIVELTCTMEEAFEMLKQGELDGFVSMDAYGTTGSSIPKSVSGRMDQSLSDTFRRADQSMYHNKRAKKRALKKN